MSGVEAGMAGGEGVGAGIIGAGFGLGGAITAAGFGAAFLGAAFLGAAFLGAAFLTAFFAFALTFFFAFTGRVFLFAALFLAERLTELRLAFAIGRFDLRFFAMIILLLKHRANSRRESSPEKVCCHLCVSTGVADADCVGCLPCLQA